eukprot:SAG11_NODE_15152_length_587_cov_1.194672_1_plen_91_part_00
MLYPEIQIPPYPRKLHVPDDTDLAAFHDTVGAHLDALQDVVRKHQNLGWALHECRLNADLRKPVKAALTPSTTSEALELLRLSSTTCVTC